MDTSDPSTLMNAVFVQAHSFPEDFDTDGQWIKCCCDRWKYKLKDCVNSDDIDNITGVFV